MILAEVLGTGGDSVAWLLALSEPSTLVTFPTRYLASSNLFVSFLDPYVVSGVVVIGILLFMLLVMRRTAKLAMSRTSTSGVIQRLEEPELSPHGIRQSASPKRRTSKENDSTGMMPIFPPHEGDPVTAPMPPKTDLVATAEAARSLEANDLRAAAAIWERLCRWPEAARCHEKRGDNLKASDLYLALGARKKALPHLRAALMASPANEQLRLRLIATLFDEGQQEEAEALIAAVLGEDSPARASGKLLESLGGIYESLGNRTKALELYRQALDRDSSLQGVDQRIIFLRQLERLGGPPSEDEASPATQLLNRYLRDSSVGLSTRAVGSVTTPAHEIIVGHLALGFRQSEPDHSVRSIFSLARRFNLVRLVSESPRCAVFEATDELLDFPLALKVYRLNLSEQEYETVRDRLRAIAQLNHPNLAKVTFADRDGAVLRVTTEYLPGGNLREFMTKLGGVGVPLLIRMAMHLASALHTAHLRGIPHGDIRPENILIGQDQRIKLMDFAISPIPVHRVDPTRLVVQETMDTPKLSDFVVSNEGVRSDLLQFGELLEFLINHARRTTEVTPSGQNDPLEDLKELVQRVRGGGFTSVLRLWQVLEQIFERAMPGGTPSPEGTARPRS